MHYSSHYNITFRFDKKNNPTPWLNIKPNQQVKVSSLNAQKICGVLNIFEGLMWIYEISVTCCTKY